MSSPTLANLRPRWARRIVLVALLPMFAGACVVAGTIHGIAIWFADLQEAYADAWKAA